MRKWLLLCVLFLVVLPFSASAQDTPVETPEVGGEATETSGGEAMTGTPSVSVTDQVVLDGTVLADRVQSGRGSSSFTRIAAKAGSDFVAG
jgi:hypothetical protein